MSTGLSSADPIAVPVPTTGAEAPLRATGPVQLQGTIVSDTAIVIAAEMEPDDELSYEVPERIGRHMIGGLRPCFGYSVAIDAIGGARRVRVSLGGTATTDPAGILCVGFSQTTPVAPLGDNTVPVTMGPPKPAGRQPIGSYYYDRTTRTLFRLTGDRWQRVATSRRG